MATQTPELPLPKPPEPTPHGHDPLAQTLALIQPWIDYVPQKQRRLGLFIFLALLIHLVAIFIIRIDTTRADLRHQTRNHVTVENPQLNTAQYQSSDNFWDRLTDPRLFLMPPQAPPGISSDEPAPNFGTINSNLSSLDPPPPARPEEYQLTRQAAPPLEQRVGETMQPARQPFSYDETPPAIAATTTWGWEKALGNRQPGGMPALPSPISDTDLSPTQLRIAVNAAGAVEHVLVEQSCGSGRLDLDQQAVTAARKIRFRPAEKPGLQWGQVTVFWHYSPKPREDVVPSSSSGT